MKAISTYISEKLKISNTKEKYNYYPTNTEDLKMIVDDLLEERGWDADLNDIDVSKIDNIGGLFAGSLFNGDISEWDVSNVIDMSSTFQHCRKFNSDISSWNVSKVKIMSFMFADCEKFNSDISQWDVSSCEKFFYTFRGCDSFNQDISGWNISSATTMVGMFDGCSSFDQDLSKWTLNTNKVRIEGMFVQCKIFKSNKKFPKFVLK